MGKELYVRHKDEMIKIEPVPVCTMIEGEVDFVEIDLDGVTSEELSKARMFKGDKMFNFSKIVDVSDNGYTCCQFERVGTKID